MSRQGLSRRRGEKKGSSAESVGELGWTSGHGELLIGSRVHPRHLSSSFSPISHHEPPLFPEPKCDVVFRLSGTVILERFKVGLRTRPRDRPRFSPRSVRNPGGNRYSVPSVKMASPTQIAGDMGERRGSAACLRKTRAPSHTGSANSRPAISPPPSRSGSATSIRSSASPAPSSGPPTAAAPTPTRRTRRSAPSTASAAASPRAGSRNWPIATTCGGCW